MVLAGDTNSLPIQVHTNKGYHFWINLHERSLIFYMLHHFIKQCYIQYLYSIETVTDQYLQLILQCYFNGHAVAPLVVAGAFLITGFWLAVTSWELRLFDFGKHISVIVDLLSTMNIELQK